MLERMYPFLVVVQWFQIILILFIKAWEQSGRGVLLFMHICKIFIPVPFTLTFIALVKLCNDVVSPFRHFFFHPCFLTVKSQLETKYVCFVVFFPQFFSVYFFSFLLLPILPYKTLWQPINVESDASLLCGVIKGLHLGESTLLPSAQSSESWSGVTGR